MTFPFTNDSNITSFDGQQLAIIIENSFTSYDKICFKVTNMCMHSDRGSGFENISRKKPPLVMEFFSFHDMHYLYDSFATTHFNPFLGSHFRTFSYHKHSLPQACIIPLPMFFYPMEGVRARLIDSR